MTETHLKEAIESRAAMTALLDSMVAVARPNEGAAKILIVLARLARPSCDWVDGALRIDIEGNAKQTVLSVTEELGGGMRERVFPRLTLPVPFDEIKQSLRLAPRAIEPLIARTQDGKLVLMRKTRPSTIKPPSFKLAEDCLRKSLPPVVRKTLAPAPGPKKSSPELPSAAGGGGLINFSIPRAPKMLDFGNFAPAPADKRAPPPVPRRPKPKDGG